MMNCKSKSSRDSTRTSKDRDCNCKHLLSTLLIHNLGRGLHLLLGLHHEWGSICLLSHDHAFVLGLQHNWRVLFLGLAVDLGVERLAHKLAFDDNQDSGKQST